MLRSRAVQIVEAKLLYSVSSAGNGSDRSPPYEEKSTEKEVI
jgi:hypothetical protein